MGMSMEKKIYEYLKTCDQPVRTSDIMHHIKGASREEIGEALTAMQHEEAIFRSVHNGKAFYSIDEKKGQGITPWQRQVSGGIENTNYAIRYYHSETNMTVDADHELLWNLADDMDIPEYDLDRYQLQYHSGQQVQLKNFTIPFPDGFASEESEDGDSGDIKLYRIREGSSEDDHDIDIFIQSKNLQVGKDAVKYPEFLAYYQGNKYCENGIMSQKKFVQLPGCKYPTLALFDEMNLMFAQLHYIVNVFLANGTMVYISIYSDGTAVGENNAMLEMLSDFVNRIVPSENWPKREAFEKDPRFLVKDKRSYEKWLEHVEGYINQLNATRLQACDMEIAAREAEDKPYSFIVLEDAIRPHMIWALDEFNMICKEVVVCCENWNETVTDKKQLQSMIEEVSALLTEYADIFEEVIIDDDEIHIDSDIKAMKTKLSALEASVLNDVKKLEDEKNKQKRLAEEAKKRKEEEERKQYEEKFALWAEKCEKIELERTNYAKKIQDEEWEKRIAVIETKRDNAIEEAEKVIQEFRDKMTNAEQKLASLGLFSFGEKSAQKKIIEDAKSRISTAETEKETAESAFKLESLHLDLEYNTQRSLYMTMAEKKFPFPEEPKMPEWMRRPVFDKPVNTDLTATVKRQKNMENQLEKYKQIFLDRMVDGKQYTVTELIKATGLMENITTTTTAKILDELVQTFQVEKEIVRGRSCYRLISYTPVNKDAFSSNRDEDQVYKTAFLKCMQPGIPYTTTDLIRLAGLMEKITTSRATGILCQLEISGVLEREIMKGKSYYKKLK